MNRFMKPGDDELDWLFFEYLEGVLSQEQTRELEARLATDPSLKEELEHWKAAFLVPEYHNTEQLEKRLLKPNLKFANISIATLIIMLFTVMVCWLPFSIEKPMGVVVPSGQLAFPPTVEREQERSVEKKQSTAEKAPLSAISPPQPRIKKSIEAPSSPKMTISYELLEPTTLALDESLRVADLNLLPVRIVPIPVPAPKKVLTRKQKRQIAKMKEKALQRRRANEFLKGNDPYVVPLNTEKF